MAVAPDTAVHRQPLQIDPGHPALAGHFPGNPVVPGVVVLDHVVAAAERWIGAAPELRLPQVKFLQPLLPGQAAQIVLESILIEPSLAQAADVSVRLRFRIERGEILLASGELIAAAVPAGAGSVIAFPADVGPMTA